METVLIIQIVTAVGFTVWGVLLLATLWRKQQERKNEIKDPAYLCTTRLIKQASSFMFLIMVLTFLLSLMYDSMQRQDKIIQTYQSMIEKKADPSNLCHLGAHK